MNGLGIILRLWAIIGIVCFGLGQALYGISQVQIKGSHNSTSGNFRANPNADLEWVPDDYVIGKSTDGTWFGTFCLEKNDRVGSGKIYDVALNDGSMSGGRSGAIDGKDPISVGTAYLYEQFVLGTLTGFTYGNRKSAKQLQNAIWFLEGEITGLNQGYRKAGWGGFLALAQALPNYAEHYPGAKVQVMNLTRNGGSDQHQDQLVYTNVPDNGGSLVLALLGLAGIFVFARCSRSNKKLAA